MRSVLQRVLPESVSDVWIDVLEAVLRPELSEAAPGHCLRVAGLPRPILERLTARLAVDPPPGSEVYFVDRQKGPEPWRVLVHKVVERRNAEEGAVLALFPPDVLLAAGDSVDISTFREFPSSGLIDAVEAELVQRIPEPLRTRALDVLEDLARRDWIQGPTGRLSYLSTVAGQDTDAVEVAGGALYTLGLVPDFALFDRPEEFHHRLGQRNIPVVRRLTGDNATPIERVLRLNLTDDAFSDRLVTLFRQYDPGDVHAWGELVATDPLSSDLSLEKWPLAGTKRPTDALRIDVDALKLPRRPEDGLLLFDPSKTTLIVRWQTTPPPADVVGLAAFRIEIVSSDRAVAWESPLIKIAGGKTPHRSRTLKDLSAVDPGVYFVRVIALSMAGEPIHTPTARDGALGLNSRSSDSPDGASNGDMGPGKQTNETEDFLVVAADDVEDIGDFQPISNTLVADYAEAELLARWEVIGMSGSEASVHAKEIEWTTPPEARAETASATIRFDVQHQYTVRVSQRLRRLELGILAAPESAGLLTLNSLAHEADPDLSKVDLPSDIFAARRTVFEAISQTAVEGGRPISALANLCQLSGEIEEYAAAYLRWLDTGGKSPLLLDIVRVRMPEHGTVALIAPTHPVRMLWLLQQQQLARSWTAEAASRGGGTPGLIGIWQRTFSAHGVPSLLVLGAEEGYLDAGPLLGGWGAFLPPGMHDSRAVQAALRARFGSGAAHQTEADVSPNALANKFELFLRQHPYTPVLVINVVNPGDARLVVGALVELEGRRRSTRLPDVRYEVRLFTDASLRQGVGEAFAEMADPERPISEVADSLVAPGQSLLFPKLSWSRHPLTSLVREPQRFPAHVTLLLDAFAVSVRVAKIDSGDRSSFVHGLIQDPPRRSVGEKQSYGWIRRAGAETLPRAAGGAHSFATPRGNAVLDWQPAGTGTGTKRRDHGNHERRRTRS